MTLLRSDGRIVVSLFRSLSFLLDHVFWSLVLFTIIVRHGNLVATERKGTDKRETPFRAVRHNELACLLALTSSILLFFLTATYVDYVSQRVPLHIAVKPLF